MVFFFLCEQKNTRMTLESKNHKPLVQGYYRFFKSYGIIRLLIFILSQQYQSFRSSVIYVFPNWSIFLFFQ
jgi:hypothetical protein